MTSAEMAESGRINSMPYEAWIAETIAKRNDGAAPNFDCEHECPNCHRRYLCPERYIMAQCSVCLSSQQLKMGTGRVFRCSPCAGKYDDELRRLWYEAHGID